MRKTLIFLNIFGAVSCILIAVRIVIMPLTAEIVFADEYKKKMFKCDNVMRDHLIAKNRVLHFPTSEAKAILKSAELGLTTCHEYDKLRKKMKIWGLNDRQLALIGLEAIEENAEDIQEFVKTHEFKY